jgi:Ribonucleotide reductase, barrel domain
MPRKRATTRVEEVYRKVDFGLSVERFRKSDRLQMALAGTRNRFGASCNTFVVGDSIESIGEALQWSLHVSHQQGAPSLNFGALRPRGSGISTGGVSGGAVPFMLMLDAQVHEIKRDTYKKGAGIAWLPWWHEDLREFLAADFKSIYRGVLVPLDGSPLPPDTEQLLVEAYEAGKCFICKEPEAVEGEQVTLNLCTEIELPSLGACVLGVVNLSQYEPDNIHELPTDFERAAEELLKDSRQSRLLQKKSQVLACSSSLNDQFGLGVSGLASMLAIWDASYEKFTEALEAVVDTTKLNLALENAKVRLEKDKTPAHTLVFYIVLAYAYARTNIAESVVKAFCVQPSATGAYECADACGYYSSPELQPVIGIRDDSGVYTMRKSQLKGDTKVTFHPRTETIDEVPYEIYRRLCCAWQKLLDLTGLGHRHSACYYGEAFTTADLRTFLKSEQKNLYYRLPYYNPVALNKSQVGEGLEAEDFSLDSLLLGGSCQVADDSDCGCGG